MTKDGPLHRCCNEVVVVCLSDCRPQVPDLSFRLCAIVTRSPLDLPLLYKVRVRERERTRENEVGEKNEMLTMCIMKTLLYD